jgi:hypothetical protein
VPHAQPFVCIRDASMAKAFFTQKTFLYLTNDETPDWMKVK